MKNAIVVALLFIVLVAYFSFVCPYPTDAPNGIGPRYKGDSGMVIPGGSDLPVEVIVEPVVQESPSEQSKGESTEYEPTEANEETRTEPVSKEEHRNMNGMLLAFWHGVAAVLIGEISALLVALAWSKIGGDNDGV
jgi:hypothetical protein